MPPNPLIDNMLSTAVMAFVLGLGASLLKGDLSLPKDAFGLLASYLFFAIGLMGGIELAHAQAGVVAGLAAITLLFECVTPVSACLILRKFCRLNSADSAGVAARYD